MNEERSREIPLEFDPDEIAVLRGLPDIRIEGQHDMRVLRIEGGKFAGLLRRAEVQMDVEIRRALADGWPPFIEGSDMHVTHPEGYSTALFRIREGGYVALQLRCRMP